MEMDLDSSEEMQKLLQVQRQQLYQAWKSQPETARFFSELEASKQEVMEAWSRQAFVSDDIYRMALMNATALGGMDVINQLIEKKEFADE